MGGRSGGGRERRRALGLQPRPRVLRPRGRAVPAHRGGPCPRQDRRSPRQPGRRRRTPQGHEPVPQPPALATAAAQTRREGVLAVLDVPLERGASGGARRRARPDHLADFGGA
jgi:hypothetical protein